MKQFADWLWFAIMAGKGSAGRVSLHDFQQLIYIIAGWSIATMLLLITAIVLLIIILRTMKERKD